VTPRSLGRTQIVWAAALSALLAFAGHEVWARDHQGSSAQAQSGSNQPQNPSGRGGGQRGPFPGDRGPGPNPNPSPVSVAWKWWEDVDVKKDLSLRADQSSRIDRYYSARVKEIDPVAQEYLKETELLDKMLAERVVEDSTLSLEMTKYYALRTEVNKSRYLMLYHIAKVLDVDQYAKLRAIFDKRLKEADAHRGGRTGGEGPMPHGLR
jgi:hypothetical protein